MHSAARYQAPRGVHLLAAEGWLLTDGVTLATGGAEPCRSFLRLANHVVNWKARPLSLLLRTVRTSICYLSFLCASWWRAFRQLNISPYHTSCFPDASEGICVFWWAFKTSVNSVYGSSMHAGNILHRVTSHDLTIWNCQRKPNFSFV